MLARIRPESRPARRPGRARRGVTLVESAVVLSVFLMLLFGLFEYCRFLMVLHVAGNAARDGARYAAVNVDKPGTFNVTDYTDSDGRVYDSIVDYTTARMGGTEKNVQGFAVAVYPVDSAGLAQTPPQVVAKTLVAGKPTDPFKAYNATTNPLPPWNQASFSERIAVTIKGTYQPITPVLLFLPSQVPINVTSLVGSEG